MTGGADIWPVFSGAAFDLFECDTGDYYDSVYAEEIRAHLYDKRLAQRDDSRSAFSHLPHEVTDDPDTLPCLRPRIAFRDVTRASDTRTFRCALIPPNRVLTHQAPYLLQTEGTASDEAYVLGVLSSMVFDWQTRQTAELHMTFEQLNQSSLPDPGEGHPVRDLVAQIAGQLAAAADERFAGWAQQAGLATATDARPGADTPTLAADAHAREELLAELDACVAVLYGLNTDDIRVLYDTFARPGQWDARRDAVIAAMARVTTASRPTS